jgi:diguanylate cyclase (GGDEF)-like protein
VSLRYHVDTADIAFTSGRAPSGAHTFLTNLSQGWSVTTAGAVTADGIFADRTAVELLSIGIVLSLLLGLFVVNLGTGRERARRLVAQRTGQLRHQALHDGLTGLANRELVMDRIEQFLVRSRRQVTNAAALFLDLDDFKNVNDSLGHQAGDRLLVAVAARLASTLRDADTIGRMGGDEFVVLVETGPLDAGPQLVAQRLLDVMRQPFELDGASMPLRVNISIGIATGDRASAGDLLRDADLALYQAKARGKNRYETFDATMQIDVSRRTDLEFELRSALSANQYRLMYQPIYNLDDLTITGVEALIRWDQPGRGLVSPDEFIPILEQTGQIQEVGRWVLRAACTQMAAWHAQGDTLSISVNVSGRQLDHDSVITDIRDALNESKLPPEALTIEVTETALMRNVDATAQRLEAIKQLGVKIAIDDFGTGYSSLAYLRQFPVDCLKIDRSFTNAISTSPESKALIKTLVQLGKDLGLTTLAEGIETTQELDLLRSAHVDQAQGFLMARPLDPESLESQLLAPIRPTTPTGAPA